MKYRLKSDHSKTLEVTPAAASKPGRPWKEINFTDRRLQGFRFEVPETFLEVSGWEPEPKPKPDGEYRPSEVDMIHNVHDKKCPSKEEYQQLFDNYWRVVKDNAELGMALVELLKLLTADAET